MDPDSPFEGGSGKNLLQGLKEPGGKQKSEGGRSRPYSMGYTNRDERLDLSDPDGCVCYTCCECCGCQRIRILSKGVYFCCCCPIYIGIQVVAFTIFTLTLFYTLNAFIMWSNRYVHGYYPLFLLLLTAPIWYSTITFLRYGGSATKDNRLKLFWAVIFAIVTVFLYTTWELIYISQLYEHTYYWRGFGDPENGGTYEQETKQFACVVEFCTSLAVIVFLIIAAVCCYQWAELADDNEEELKKENESARSKK